MEGVGVSAFATHGRRGSPHSERNAAKYWRPEKADTSGILLFILPQLRPGTNNVHSVQQTPVLTLIPSKLEEPSTCENTPHRNCLRSAQCRKFSLLSLAFFLWYHAAVKIKRLYAPRMKAPVIRDHNRDNRANQTLALSDLTEIGSHESCFCLV